MSICPECGKKIRGGNKKKKGSVWRHKECDKEARKAYQRKGREKYLDGIRLIRLAKSRRKDLKNSMKEKKK
jgi:uncharacterized radical SAM superfamily Fe-S cluster-containing enzyme